MSRPRILAIEPYYGGSHRAVLDGLVKRVEADWTLLTLPARKWKWRMRGSAITMAAQARSSGGDEHSSRPFDLVFASTFLNLAEWRGLVGTPLGSVPAIVYFHENQLVYPNRHTAEWDFQFPLTNITTALSAQRCLFNTRWNLETFLAEIPGFIRQFPDHRPSGLASEIAEKSAVVAPPFDPEAFDRTPVSRGDRCRIVWPHRWEHDKNPEAFFSAVEVLAGEGLDFEVAVVGQSFRETSAPMRAAAESLGNRLVHCDEPTDRGEYAAVLASADVAVSTAVNEFFGLAMIEACYAGCTPLVPDRLAYPELYGSEYLYTDQEQLVARLRELVLRRPTPGSARAVAERFTFEQLVPLFEEQFSQVIG